MPDAPANVKRTFEIWAGMRKRCFNKKDWAYKWYGGRGIGISDEWGTFNGFVADMGLAPEGLTLERVDVNSGYCKSNCVWIALNKQAQNKTTTLWVTYDGITSCLKSLCSRLGVPYMRTYKRYRVRGWDLERALTQ